MLFLSFSNAEFCLASFPFLCFDSYSASKTRRYGRSAALSSAARRERDREEEAKERKTKQRLVKDSSLKREEGKIKKNEKKQSSLAAKHFRRTLDLSLFFSLLSRRAPFTSLHLLLRRRRGLEDFRLSVFRAMHSEVRARSGVSSGARIRPSVRRLSSSSLASRRRDMREAKKKPLFPARSRSKISTKSSFLWLQINQNTRLYLPALFPRRKTLCKRPLFEKANAIAFFFRLSVSENERKEKLKQQKKKKPSPSLFPPFQNSSPDSTARPRSSSSRTPSRPRQTPSSSRTRA